VTADRTSYRAVQPLTFGSDIKTLDVTIVKPTREVGR